MTYLRARRSIKVTPGFKIKLNKRSVSVTGGGPGAHNSVNSSGRRTTTVGIPGSGLSLIDTRGGGADRRTSRDTTGATRSAVDLPRHRSATRGTFLSRSPVARGPSRYPLTGHPGAHVRATCCCSTMLRSPAMRRGWERRFFEREVAGDARATPGVCLDRVDGVLCRVRTRSSLPAATASRRPSG